MPCNIPDVSGWVIMVKHGCRRHSGWSSLAGPILARVSCINIFILAKLIITRNENQNFVTILSLYYTIWYGKYGKKEGIIAHKLQLSC